MSCPKIKKRHLTIGELLHQGAYSAVYKASWWETCMTWKDVAAKKVDKLNTTEIDIMSSLNHNNVMQLFGVVDEGPHRYMVLEWCSEHTLREGLDRLVKGKDHQKYQKHLMDEVAIPLQYLRHKKIVHHEITSQNYVFTLDRWKSPVGQETMTNFEHLKLTNFKHAKRVDIANTSEDTLDWYPWTAPEFLQEAEPFPTADIFSLGVVLWEILTLNNPFQVAGCAQIPVSTTSTDEAPVYLIPPAKEKAPQHLPIPEDCPEQLANMLKQCWHKDWKKRPCIEHVAAVITSEDFTLPTYKKPAMKAIEM